MSKQNIIALSGFKGHGKDAFFKWLKGDDSIKFHTDKYIKRDINYRRFAFADKLKNECQFLYPDIDFIIKKDKKSRSIMYSTANSKIVKDLYYYCRDIDLLLDNKGDIVITDLRFAREKEYLDSLKNVNITYVRVIRDKDIDSLLEPEYESLFFKYDVYVYG